MVAKVISISNLKGGVGKTTLTMALAEYLAGNLWDKRVLAIDLDPQSNLTHAMMIEDIWLHQFENRGLTLPYLFKNSKDFLSKIDPDNFIVKTLVSNVRNNNSFNCLHLIPSSPVMFEIQDDLPLAYLQNNLNPLDVFQYLLKPLLTNYDYILIDCPPNLNNIIKGAFAISDFCLIPCVANRMSTFGLDLILKRVERVNKEYRHHLKILGIVISRYNGTFSQNEELNKIRDKDSYPEVFESKIPEKAKVAESLYSLNQMTYKQKYGDAHEIMKSLTQEFIQKVGE